MKRKLLYTLLGFLCLFIITNPSANAFKEHLGRNSYSGLIREHNFFVYSTYLDNEESEKYVAILGNFFEIKRNEPAIDYSHVVIVDTAATANISNTEVSDEIRPFDTSQTNISSKHDNNNPLLAKFKKFKKEIYSTK